jgi:hypothetical protein
MRVKSVTCLLALSAVFFAAPVFANTCNKPAASCEGPPTVSKRQTGGPAHTKGVVRVDDSSVGAAQEPKTQSGKPERESIDPMYRGG